ncbi:hypothetical protein C1Y63_10215 [Corynebacterium sp. 13CS0277]|uniref:hypothetical protein n=1 Tax=Corynebacterium sp. 13CS0277 TaxID=2071994 RepID=UPI000D02559E|nr:hypothetical protein [Corynebacterium sp. 13CS0277]PRQ10660.1 hypothetical protein C1Y63_10215 [Corynebacterium sp. 13CS0277]
MNIPDMLHNLGEVLLAGLVLGAGLPALFALGIRFAAPVDELDAQGNVIGHHQPNPVSRALGYVFFAIIAAAILIGILWITKAVIYDSFGLDIFGTEVGGGSPGH